MRKLADFFPETTRGKMNRTRVMHSLWMAMKPGEGTSGMPDDWDPDPRDVSALRLEHIYEFGAKSRSIVRDWLAQYEEAP